MNIIGIIISLFIGICAGFIISSIISRYKAKTNLNSAKNQARLILENAQKEVEQIKERGKIEIQNWKLNAQAKFEKENSKKKSELLDLERKIYSKAESLDKREELLERKKRELMNLERRIKDFEGSLLRKEKKLKIAIDEEIHKLEKIANMSQQDAVKELMKRIEDQAEYEMAAKLKEMEEETNKIAKQKAQEILSYTIQRGTLEYVSESTVSVVSLPDDDMKGRIIGREGRNIRAFESITGVDLIIDDTPEAVTISCFDPIRREISKRALQDLINDGRIHPARVEEIISKYEKEIKNEIIQTGEETAFEFGITDLHPELIKILGKLKYRTSYGQNVLGHSKQVAKITALLAAELDLDVEVAKRGGLLHDIGKGIDREIPGNHQDIGADFAKKYGESPIIVNAIQAHHEDVPFESSIAVIVQVADAVSAARPGARRESFNLYIKRITKLETIAKSFIGVEKAFAIQAGREIRVIVSPNEIDDKETFVLTRSIAKKIENEVQYPGSIKIVIVRETRAIEFAR
jgi:ribonuclease Y